MNTYEPSGSPDTLPSTEYGSASVTQKCPEVKDSIRIIETDKPWLLEVWELLPTKAPNPSICQPYCCYIRTVIFYHRPYIVRPWHRMWICNGRRRAQEPGQEYERYDEIEHQIGWDSVVEHKGERFKCGGGRVVWKGKRWWMRCWARREAQPEVKLAEYMAATPDGGGAQCLTTR